MYDLSRSQKLSARDLVSIQIESYFENLNSSVASSSIDIFHKAVPLDRILILDSWSIQVTPGTLMTTQSVQILTQMGTRSIRLEIFEPGYVHANAAPTFFTMIKEHLLLPGAIPWMEVNLTGTVSGVTVNSQLSGFLLPRGQMPTGF